MATQSIHRQIRERAVSLREEGHSAEMVSRWLKISKRSVERYWKLYQQQGSVEPKQRGGYRRSRLTGHEGTLRQWISEQPDLTLEQIKQRFESQLGVTLGVGALWHRIDKLGFSFKKNAARQRAKPSRRAGRQKKVAGATT